MSGNANSGRRPTPAAETLLKGNPGKRKESVTETAFPAGELHMPETLGPAGIEAWRFVIQQCSAVPGMLKLIDVYSLGMFCHAIQDVTEIREHLAESGKRVGELPLSERKALREAEATAIKLGARYGWTPSDRVGKVFGGEGGPADPLQALLMARAQFN
jgi:phage terminase small subunit